MKSTPARPETCPCGSQRPFARCCGPLLSGDEQAATAEQLMRSRYSAYVAGDALYLERTWHPSTRPARLQLDSSPRPQWKGLSILASTAGGVEDSQGTVEFIARYKTGGRAGKLHENSRFVKENDRWYYLDADAGQ